MSDIGIGKLIDGLLDSQKDAIHIAVVPVIATEELYPGQEIGLVEWQGANEDFQHTRFAGASLKPIGIVDPFLKEPVKMGQKFWMFLNPGSITSLRHDWTHPAFVEVDKVEGDLQKIDKAITEEQKAANWLINFAKLIGYEFDYLLEIGQKVLNTTPVAANLLGNLIHVGDDDAQDIFNENKFEFLKNMAIFMNSDRQPQELVDKIYFSCAC